MNQVSKAKATPLEVIEVNYPDIANKYHNADEATVSEYVSDLADQSAANSNEPISALSILTKTNRFYAWLDRWTQSSYDAWEKREQLPYHPWD